MVGAPPTERLFSVPTPVRRLTPTLLVALAFAALAMLMSAGSPTAEAASKCRLKASESQPSSGKPTYNLQVKVSGTSCSTGKKVMKAYHSCRSRTSVSCSKKLVGRDWRCSGRKTSTISTQFSATYTCKYGKRRVTGSFQQNT